MGLKRKRPFPVKGSGIRRPGDRNFQDPRYVAWRKAIRTRDRGECRKCGIVPKRGQSVCHHIRRWADQPMLRFVVSNGVTLCRKCHKFVTGNEDAWIPFFINAVNTPPKRDWYGHLNRMRDGKGHYKAKYTPKPMTSKEEMEKNKAKTEYLRKKREAERAKKKDDGGET